MTATVAVLRATRGLYAGVASTEPGSGGGGGGVADARANHMGWALGSAIEPGSMPLTAAGDALLNAYMDQVALSGSKWVRVACSWQHVQKGTVPNPAYDWTQPDRIVEAAKVRNLRVILTISHCPRWAALNPNNTTSSWRAPSAATLAVGGAFSVWCAAVAARYGVGGSTYPGTVEWFEVWNEPNLPKFWADEAPSKTRYATMLTRGYDAIKAVNSLNQVMNAGMAGYTNLAEFDAHIIPTGKYDAYAVHWYPPMRQTYPSSLSDLFGPHGIDKDGTRVRNAMTAAGYGSRQVILTETGYHTATIDTAPAYLAGVSQADQAAGTRLIIEYLEAQSWCELVMFHTFADPGTANTVQDRYGTYCTKTYARKLAADEWDDLVVAEWGSGD